MANWRLAKSLIRLRDQINQVAPHRNKAADGSIGDSRHAALGDASDHNPHIKYNGYGIVTAIDVTNDPASGVAGETLSRALISDPRTKYVIFHGMIWKARTGKWEPYRGSNPHRAHVHISVKPDVYDNVEPWKLSVPSIPVKPKRPVLRKGDRGEAVRELQTKLRKFVDITVDGHFGPNTEKALRLFQRMQGLESDGEAGPAVYKALGL